MKTQPMRKLLLVAIALTAVTLMAGCQHLRKCPEPKTVRVTVDENGKPGVDQDTLHVRTGDWVVLSGPDNFEIEFNKGDTPFPEARYKTENGSIRARIDKKANPDKRYKYSVIVQLKGKRRVLDPSIIIGY